MISTITTTKNIMRGEGLHFVEGCNGRDDGQTYKGLRTNGVGGGGLSLLMI